VISGFVNNNIYRFVVIVGKSLDKINFQVYNRLCSPPGTYSHRPSLKPLKWGDKLVDIQNLPNCAWISIYIREGVWTPAYPYTPLKTLKVLPGLYQPSH